MNSNEKNTQNVINIHAEDLKNILSEVLASNQNQATNVNFTDLEKVLNSHFTKIENLLETHLNTQKANSKWSLDGLKNGLQNLKADFAEIMKNLVQGAKSNINNKITNIENKVDNLKIAAFNKIAENVLKINDVVKDLAIKLEKIAAQVNDISAKVDEKFALKSNVPVSEAIPINQTVSPSAESISTSSTNQVTNEPKVTEASFENLVKNGPIDILSEESINAKLDNIKNSVADSLNRVDKETYRDFHNSVSVGKSDTTTTIYLENTKDNTWGEGDIKIDVNNENLKATLYKKSIDNSENWSSSSWKKVTETSFENLIQDAKVPLAEKINDAKERLVAQTSSTPETIIVNKIQVPEHLKDKVIVLNPTIKERVANAKERSGKSLVENKNKESKKIEPTR